MWSGIYVRNFSIKCGSFNYLIFTMSGLFIDEEVLPFQSTLMTCQNSQLNNFYFLFFTCLYKGRGGKIRTNDLRLIRYSSQPIKLSLEDANSTILVSIFINKLICIFIINKKIIVTNGLLILTVPSHLFLTCA